MRYFLSLPLLSLGAHVYHRTNLRPDLALLIDSEAEGWAVPVQDTEDESVWFSTQRGNDILQIGPESELALLSPLMLSLDPTGIARMKILKPEPFPSGGAELPVMDVPMNWVVETEMKSENVVLRNMKSFIFSLFAEEIQLDDFSFADLEKAWSPETVRLYRHRLQVKCDVLSSRKLHVMIGNVPLTVLEMKEPIGLFAVQKSEGWCPSNIVFNGEARVLGIALLEQYDVVLDAANSRIVLLPKSSTQTHLPPLRTYRVDSEFHVPNHSNGWRWILSPGPVEVGDFIMTVLQPESPRFDILCLKDACADKVSPPDLASWIGRPAVTITPDSITVTESVGWERFGFSSISFSRKVSLSFQREGIRMKRNDTVNVDGRFIELYAVSGRFVPGEFTLHEWPGGSEAQLTLLVLPLIHDALLPTSRRWFGKPKITTLPDNRIQITAEDDACDRIVQITMRQRPFLDFSVEACRYKQVPSAAFGYAFELASRDETDPRIFEVRSDKMLRTGVWGHLYSWELTLGSERVFFALIGPWHGEPILRIDPETKRITITPSQRGPWIFRHTLKFEGEKAFLSFFDPHRRLAVPPGFSLADPLWSFKPEEIGHHVTIRNGFCSRGEDGSFVLEFSGADRMTVEGPQTGSYSGVPKIRLSDSGELVVRSDGDNRYRFTVTARPTYGGGFEIKFWPSAYTKLGSYPVTVETSDEHCPICLEEFDVGEQIAQTKCNHRFHLNCLRRLEKRECPYCRGSLDLV